MAIDEAELEKRKKVALAAIKAAYGTKEDEFGATLFVSHHLEEIESSYWEERFNTPKPEATEILDSLVLQNDFDEEDDIDSLDFTLPGEATNYLICVSFDEDGGVEDIAMES
ncbi:MAG: DUF2004 domain-containing protein [Verrucomicrobiota bacterium]